MPPQTPSSPCTYTICWGSHGWGLFPVGLAICQQVCTVLRSPWEPELYGYTAGGGKLRGVLWGSCCCGLRRASIPQRQGSDQRCFGSQV
jgi:hypothetical protein